MAANRPGALALLKLKEDIAQKVENKHPELDPKALLTIVRAEQLELIENTIMCSINFETVKTNTLFSKTGDGKLGFLLRIDGILEANQTNSTNELKADLREGFIPISLPVPKGCEKLDNVSKSNIEKLKTAGKYWVVENKVLIQSMCNKLLATMDDKTQDDIENLNLLTNNAFENDVLQEYSNEIENIPVLDNSSFNGTKDIIALIEKLWKSGTNQEQKE